MTAWPETLPSPEIASYSTNDEYNILRTDMESGPPRQAKRSAHYMTTGSFTLKLNSSQMTDFQAVIPASNFGADWITDVPLDTGLGKKSHRMRFLGVSRKTLLPQNGLYELTIKFETDEHL